MSGEKYMLLHLVSTLCRKKVLTLESRNSYSVESSNVESYLCLQLYCPFTGVNSTTQLVNTWTNSFRHRATATYVVAVRLMLQTFVTVHRCLVRNAGHVANRQFTTYLSDRKNSYYSLAKS